MRILIVADGRSPFARNWIHYLTEHHEVHLLSSFACEPIPGLASLEYFRVAFSQIRGELPAAGRPPGGARAIKLRAWIRHWLGPFTIPGAARSVSKSIADKSPGLVHAMRIPYEGMVTAQAATEVPFVLSVWGNDFTLHAPSSPGTAWYTRLALSRANALHTDCQRDLRLAQRWGYDTAKPSIVLPGNGGVNRRIFHPQPAEPGKIGPQLERILGSIPAGSPMVVNPRGFRGYVRNDTFFRSIPFILERLPETIFMCPTMAGESVALEWISRLNLQNSVHLLPRLTPHEMAAVYRRSQVMVSPSTHDGTPNTLLEALASGCFPVAGDLESIREWIEPQYNGLLIDPDRPRQLADAVIEGLLNGDLRRKAFTANQALIEKRAAYEHVMPAVEAFYQRVAFGQAGASEEQAP
jgi:glycosyltransferase involved in cell wall biosynthesis